jgi:hypothetical protein
MYYNADGGKSNITIFKGKEAKLNDLILEKLAFGAKTTMELARLISQEDGEKIKQTYSVIARKGGALDRLSEMGFVSRKEDKTWTLTIKGFSYALFRLNNKGALEDILQHIDPEQLEQLKKVKSEFIKMFKKTPFAPNINLIAKYLTAKQAVLELISCFEYYLNQGVDFKKISDDDLLGMMAVRTANKLFKMFFQEPPPGLF